MSFFFIAFYAEALFLLTSIAGVYFARRGRFIASGAAIALAGATRPVAFLLAVPYIVEFWQQHNFIRTRWLRFVTGIFIAPLGMLSYLFFFAWQAGNFNLLTVYASIHTDEWLRSFTWPWITFRDGFSAAIFGTGINSDWFSRAIVWQDLTYALTGLIFAVWGLFYLRLSLALFLLASMLFCALVMALMAMRLIPCLVPLLLCFRFI